MQIDCSRITNEYNLMFNLSNYNIILWFITIIQFFWIEKKNILCGYFSKQKSA